MTQVEKVIRLIKEREYTTLELAEKMNLNPGRICSLMVKARMIVEIETRYQYEGRKKTTFYKYAETNKMIQKEEQVPKHIKKLMQMMQVLPMEIDREELLKWFDGTNGTNFGISIAELYKMAARVGIKVYKQTEKGIKYLN